MKISFQHALLLMQAGHTCRFAGEEYVMDGEFSVDMMQGVWDGPEDLKIVLDAWTLASEEAEALHQTLNTRNWLDFVREGLRLRAVLQLRIAFKEADVPPPYLSTFSRWCREAEGLEDTEYLAFKDGTCYFIFRRGVLVSRYYNDIFELYNGFCELDDERFSNSIDECNERLKNARFTDFTA